MNKVQPLSFPGGPGPDQVVPFGLDCLIPLDTVFVKQKIELLEAITGCETKNRYVILNSQSQELFKAEEESDCCTRQFCGPLRPFQLVIIDENGQDLVEITRPLACGVCCFPCCLQSIAIYSPPGVLAGIVEQEWTWWAPRFTVKNADGVPYLKIIGPCCPIACGSDVEFSIFSAEEGSNEIGKISKKWGGLIKEALTDADTFGVTFPTEMDVRMKTVLLGATFLIDFMYFEHNQ